MKIAAVWNVSVNNKINHWFTRSDISNTIYFHRISIQIGSHEVFSMSDNPASAIHFVKQATTPKLKALNNDEIDTLL